MLEEKLKSNVWADIILLLAWIAVLILDFYLSASIWLKIFAAAFIVFQSRVLSESIKAFSQYDDK